MSGDKCRGYDRNTSRGCRSRDLIVEKILLLTQSLVISPGFPLASARWEDHSWKGENGALSAMTSARRAAKLDTGDI